MLIGLAAVIALFTTLWLVSLALRNSSIVDIWLGLGLIGAATPGCRSKAFRPPLRVAPQGSASAMIVPTIV